MCARISTASILLCASVLICMTPRGAWAGPEYGPIIDSDVFLDPAIIAQPLNAPFYFDPYNRYYREDYMSRRTDEVDDPIIATGLDEWRIYFGETVDATAWADLMTKASDTELASVLGGLRGEAEAAVPGKYSSLIGTRDSVRIRAATQYVIAARQVDQLAAADTRRSWWSPPPAEEVAAVRARRSMLSVQAIAAIERELAARHDAFLRQRYAFQLVRVRFYGENREDCISAYEAHRPDLETDSSVAWRARAYVAGAHYRAHRYAEANTMYARIFDEYPPLKRAAYWGFHPQEELDWQSALGLAGSVRAQTVLWQMLGIAHDGRRAMGEIYKIDPKSDLLPLLIVREVNRLEYESSWLSSEPRTSGLRNEMQALRGFLDKASAGGNVNSPEVWEIAAAHLYALDGDTSAAGRLLDRARAHDNKNPIVLRQIRATGILADVNSSGAIAQTSRAGLAESLDWLESEAVGEANIRMSAMYRHVKQILATRHREAGDQVAAACLVSGPSPIYGTRENVDALISFLDRVDKTPYERVLARALSCSRAQLVEIKAALALYGGDIQTAATEFSKVKTAQLVADPFVADMSDCRHCETGDLTRWTYSKSAFVTRMAALEREAVANPARAAECWFELGNAFYNITWYGNARGFYEDLLPMLHVRHDCRSPSSNEPRDESLPCRAALPGQMERAESCYRKAFNASNDREFKTKAAFMAAKCQQNVYFNVRREGQPDFVAGEWSRTLCREYADTRYFAEILKECGYFRTIMTKFPAARR